MASCSYLHGEKSGCQIITLLFVVTVFCIHLLAFCLSGALFGHHMSLLIGTHPTGQRNENEDGTSVQRWTR